MSLLHRRVIVAILWVLVCAASSPALRAQAPAQAPTAVLTPEEMRVFLAEAKIVKTRSSGKGVTNTIRATLSDGRLTHDAQIQTVDVARSLFEAGAKSEVNFKDTYRFNIAAYELARLIGLDNVPMSVEREYRGKPGSMTWWLDDLLMLDGKVVDEEVRVKKQVKAPDSLRFVHFVQIMRVFDELIQNVDRNQGNAIWDKTWKMWLIDHTRTFREGRELKKPELLLTCERGLFEGLRRLTAEALAQAVGRNLTKGEVEAVMVRRDLIVKHYEARIGAASESAVLFTLAAADRVPAGSVSAPAR
ncbi:MAG TPA: hypothetical protein VIY56_14595 [Vicinamibacterales bacterium]